jgi:hypothetical protein
VPKKKNTYSGIKNKNKMKIIFIICNVYAKTVASKSTIGSSLKIVMFFIAEMLLYKL